MVYRKTGSKSIFSSLMPVSSSTRTLATCYPNSTLVHRGYDAAVSAHEAASGPSLLTTTRKEATPSSPISDSGGGGEDIRVSPKQEEERVKRADSSAARPRKRGRTEDWRRSPTPVGNDDEGDVTDLILIIHGIGQGVRFQSSISLRIRELKA